MSTLSLFVMAVVATVLWIAVGLVLWLIVTASFHHARRDAGRKLADAVDPVFHAPPLADEVQQNHVAR